MPSARGTFSGADRSSDEWPHNQPLLPQQTLIFNPAARLAALIRTSSEKSARVAGKVGGIDIVVANLLNGIAPYEDKRIPRGAN
jgi:hypothetical protein